MGTCRQGPAKVECVLCESPAGMTRKLLMPQAPKQPFSSSAASAISRSRHYKRGPTESSNVSTTACKHCCRSPAQHRLGHAANLHDELESRKPRIKAGFRLTLRDSCLDSPNYLAPLAQRERYDNLRYKRTCRKQSAPFTQALWPLCVNLLFLPK